MGLNQAAETQLIRNGMNITMPVAWVEKGTCAQQKVMTGEFSD
ncbi:hypothetical protein QVN42_01710 [Yersinia nurmii]|uniref:Uncharacterized protein n=1 Tax=Yersinia nurmii TaxID=685706 RepID=A0AAW7JU30_9GAMM|nr:hypothetical protein [Yersinia nurmii]MDN0086119.1 hypothetical protein [Yersinia nurmii]